MVARPGSFGCLLFSSPRFLRSCGGSPPNKTRRPILLRLVSKGPISRQGGINVRARSLANHASWHGLLRVEDAAFCRRTWTLYRACQAADDWGGDRQDFGPEPSRGTGFSRCARSAQVPRTDG